MHDAIPPGQPRSGTARMAAVVALVAVVGGIVAAAFRGSWGALRDAATAAHFDRDAAFLYPFVVDGLLIVAIIAAVMLAHDRGARRYCLGIIGAYTGASWLINFLHGLGLFSPDPVTHIVPGPPWYVVLVIASLLIGSIFLGTHLLIFVWRHVFPNTVQPVPLASVYQFGTEPVRDVTGVPELPPYGIEAARDAYRKSLHPDMKTLSQADLVERYRITRRQAGAVQSEVKAENGADETGMPEIEAKPGPSQNGREPA